MTDSPYIGRIVTLLLPVFSGLAGWVATLAAEYLPGNPDLDEAELTAVFVAGALAAAGVVYKWLDNRGDYEVQEANRDAIPGSTEPHAPIGLDKPE